MNNKRYPSDLTDGEWQHVKRLIPKAKAGGRPRSLDMREVLNAVFYLVRGGISWRMLPKDLPNCKSVYHYFRLWRIQGRWKAIHDRLHAKVRKLVGRNAQPSAAIIDSQSVKTTEVGGRERGYDKAKKVNGRKRHLLVDTLGLVMGARVHAASTGERDGARLLLKDAAPAMSRLNIIWADRGYSGQPLREWVRGLAKSRSIDLQVVLREYKQKVFKVQARRWVVERTFGWLGRYRRLSKDYERLTQTSETMIYLAMTRLMLTRLGGK